MLIRQVFPGEKCLAIPIVLGFRVLRCFGSAFSGNVFAVFSAMLRPMNPYLDPSTGGFSKPLAIEKQLKTICWGVLVKFSFWFSEGP